MCFSISHSRQSHNPLHRTTFWPSMENKTVPVRHYALLKTKNINAYCKTCCCCSLKVQSVILAAVTYPFWNSFSVCYKDTPPIHMHGLEWQNAWARAGAFWIDSHNDWQACRDSSLSRLVECWWSMNILKNFPFTESGNRDVFIFFLILNIVYFIESIWKVKENHVTCFVLQIFCSASIITDHTFKMKVKKQG